jgi:hypothetical protein
MQQSNGRSIAYSRMRGKLGVAVLYTRFDDRRQKTEGRRQNVMFLADL